MFRTSNPAFNNSAYAAPESWDDHEGPTVAPGGEEDALSPARARPGAMTIQGTVNKTFLLLAICIATAVVGWNGYLEWGWNPLAIVFGGAITGLILAFVCIASPKSSPVVAPLYAAAEGIFVGGLSALYASYFGERGDDGAIQLNTGLIFSAGMLTFSILGGLLAGYTTKIIRPGPWFRKAVVTSMIGIMFYWLAAIVLALFGMGTMISVFDPSNGGLISIGFSVFLVALASANLILDFEMVEVGVKNAAPRYMEWYSGFALLVTLVWLYVESLRLLAKLQSRD